MTRIQGPVRTTGTGEELIIKRWQWFGTTGGAVASVRIDATAGPRR